MSILSIRKELLISKLPIRSGVAMAVMEVGVVTGNHLMGIMGEDMAAVGGEDTGIMVMAVVGDGEEEVSQEAGDGDHRIGTTKSGLL